MNKKKIELLAPVGSMESMVSAVNNGCDAIYLGGKDFNARQSAKNFTNEELKHIIDYCHVRGVKVNLTLNILYKEDEIQNVLDFVSTMYSYGIDALIIQDIGIFSLIKKHFDIALHSSTQMTIHNIEGVKFLKELGFKRVVLSRELSLEEIKEITNNVNIEIEAFVHGAICVSYSGRCLMSSLIGERSGNRGRCAQPCRMEYKLIKDNKIYANNYLLSPRDTSTLPIIDELVNSGIHTFKVEGRMKNPEYVAQVISTYRKYIDKAEDNNFSNIEEQDFKNITQIFNRGGGSITGYYKTWSSPSMISPSPKSSGLKIGFVKSYNKKTKKCEIFLQEPTTAGDGIEIWTKTKPHCGTNISKTSMANETIVVTIDGAISKGDLVFRSFDKALDRKLKKSYEKPTRKLNVNAKVSAKIDNNIVLTLETNKACVSLSGAIVEKAKNASISKDELISRLSKTGDTPFSLNFTSVDIDDDIYMPISSINSIKREAISLLEEKIKKSYEKEKISAIYNPKIEIATKQYLTALVQNKSQFDACVNSSHIKRIYIELSPKTLDELDYFIEKAHKNNIEIFVALLWILRKPMRDDFYKMLNILEKSNIDGYLLRNYINLNTTKKIVADYTFNIFNNASLSFLNTLFDKVTLSPELNFTELNALSSKNAEVFIYGKLPLMTTHQCPVGLFVSEKGNNRFCKLRHKCDGFYLKDRTNTLFPIKNDCYNCTTTILNKAPIFTLNKKEINKLKTEAFRLSFVDEDYNEILNLINLHKKVLIDKININIKDTPFKDLEYTNGHFFRGVL